MGEATPKPKASTRKKKGDSASSTTHPTPTPTTTVESAPRLSATAKGKQPSRETTPVEPTDVQRTEAEERADKRLISLNNVVSVQMKELRLRLLETSFSEYRQTNQFADAMSTIPAESTPRLSASAKGKRPLKATTPVEPTDIQRTEAEQLKIVLKQSRQETHISQQSGSGTGKGTGSKPGVPDVPSDDSEEELSWKSSNDEKVGSQEEGNESNDDSDDGSDKDSEETV
nr:hypothetical protein [Tanacetum cinerariifolium]